MRYLRSWLFDVGMVLIVAGILAAYQGTTHHGDGTTRDAGTRESYTDVSAVALAGTLATISGVGAIAVGAVRIRRQQ